MEVELSSRHRSTVVFRREGIAWFAKIDWQPELGRKAAAPPPLLQISGVVSMDEFGAS